MRGFVEDRRKSRSVLQYEEARRAVGSSPTKLSGNRIAKEACLKSGFCEVDEIDKSFQNSDSITTESLCEFLGIPVPKGIHTNFKHGAEELNSVSRLRDAWNVAIPVVDKVCEILVCTPHRDLLKKGMENLPILSKGYKDLFTGQIECRIGSVLINAYKVAHRSLRFELLKLILETDPSFSCQSWHKL